MASGSSVRSHYGQKAEISAGIGATSRVVTSFPPPSLLVPGRPDCTRLDVDVEKHRTHCATSNIDMDNTKFEENTNLKMTCPVSRRPPDGYHHLPRFRPQMSTPPRRYADPAV